MASDKKILQSFGKQLKLARQAIGITQAELADLCGFDTTYISFLERGVRNPPLTTVCNLARALDCSPKQFFED